MIFTTSLPCNKLGRVPTTQSAGALPLLRSEDLATVNTSRDSSSDADARCSTFRRCCSFASGASAMARSCSATIVSLSTADRLPARACVQESLAQCLWSVSTVFRSTGRPPAPWRRLCPARSVSAGHEKARGSLRFAGGALSVEPQAGRALFSCSAHDIHGCPTGPGSKAPMRGTVKAKYILGDRSYIR